MARPRRTVRARSLLGAESLERRQMLAGDAWSTFAVAPVPATTPVAVIAPVVVPAIPVAVVPDIDPLYGYAFALATPRAADGFDFATRGGQTVASVDVGLVDMPLGATLDLEVVSGLQFWNGRGQPTFAAVKGGVEINLFAAGTNLRVGAKTDQRPGQAVGSVRQSLEVAVSDGLPVARRITATIGVGGVGESLDEDITVRGVVEGRFQQPMPEGLMVAERAGVYEVPQKKGNRPAERV